MMNQKIPLKWILPTLLLLTAVMLGTTFLIYNQINPPTRVLFLGNSYTYGNNLPYIFTRLAFSGGHNVRVDSVTSGGQRLIDHLQDEDVVYKIENEDWAYFILQEQSTISSVGGLRKQYMYPAARELISLIRGNGGEAIFFLIWGDKNGRVHAEGLAHNSFAEMQASINYGYEKIGAELNVPVAPVGKAWAAAIAENPNVELWAADESHPAFAGSYLAACIFYGQIFQESPVGLAYSGRLTAAEARFLQEIAAQTLQIQK